MVTTKYRIRVSSLHQSFTGSVVSDGYDEMVSSIRRRLHEDISRIVDTRYHTTEEYIAGSVAIIMSGPWRGTSLPF